MLRELEEELGITEKEMENLCLRYVTLRRSKGEIRQNYYFFADLKDDMSGEFFSNEGVSILKEILSPSVCRRNAALLTIIRIGILSSNNRYLDWKVRKIRTFQSSFFAL